VSGPGERTFACFGGTVGLYIAGPGSGGESPDIAADRVERQLLGIHDALSRFIPGSELMRLNDDPRDTVPASPLLRRFAAAVQTAGQRSGGLVDATTLVALQRSGYRDSLVGCAPLGLAETLSGPAQRRPASPAPERPWDSVRVDDAAGTISRPPGLRLDSGGIAKGLAADLVSAQLRRHSAFSVDCCGDVRIGGRAGLPRAVQVQSPLGPDSLYDFELTRGGVATSGIGQRTWRGPDGAPAHHLIDPGSGRPAYTGLVQATALAPTALLAEICAKAALLSGPRQAADWLPHGGVIVTEDGASQVIDPRSAMRRARSTARAAR
jgi:FAD:protein FMN transferase